MIQRANFKCYSRVLRDMFKMCLVLSGYAVRAFSTAFEKFSSFIVVTEFCINLGAVDWVQIDDIFLNCFFFLIFHMLSASLFLYHVSTNNKHCLLSRKIELLEKVANTRINWQTGQKDFSWFGLTSEGSVNFLLCLLSSGIECGIGTSNISKMTSIVPSSMGSLSTMLSYRLLV